MTMQDLTGQTVADRTRKIERETTYKARMLLEKKARITGLDLIARPLVNFVKFYVLKHGYRDGVEGLICSGLASAHTFLRYAKCAELLEQSTVELPSENSKASLGTKNSDQ